MGKTMRQGRIRWTDEKKEEAIGLFVKGMTVPEISSILTDRWGKEINYDQVRDCKKRFGVTNYLLETCNGMNLHDKEIYIPDGPTIISCDQHSPHHNERWLNRMMVFADKYKIKRHVAGGDLFDMSFAKWSKFKMMTGKGEIDDTLDYELDATKPVMDALDYFDMNYLILGNHENRVDRLTDGRIQARHIIDMMGEGKYRDKFTVSVYDKLFIGDDFMVVHPKSYSQISGSVAVRLAEKHHRHVLNAHGHFMAMRYDRSAKFMCCDIGGMFDVKKIDYIQKKTTTHPAWNNGFAVIMDGSIELIHKGNIAFWGIK